jgi:pyruvate/2-oxoglutarate/acetoin dehydrogenase E1 component
MSTASSNPAEMTYREAIIAAQRAELQADERVMLMGEDIGAAGGSFKLTEGLQAEFGKIRVRDTPISEQAFIGAAMGMAMTGYRPIAELMFADFMGVAFDQIVNGIAKHRFMQGGTLELPLVIRTVGGAGARFGAQHSQTGESWLLGVPGLKVFAAASPNEAYHLIRAAVRDPNPVIVIEHKFLFTRKGPVQVFEGAVPIVAGPKRLREGRDVTIVASLAMVERIQSAAQQLEAAGISAELFDMRVIRPMQPQAIVASVRKTNRLLVVEENHSLGGWGGDLVSTVVAEAFDYLDAPPERLTLPDWPVPYSPALEDAALPSVDRITATARAMVEGRGR